MTPREIVSLVILSFACPPTGWGSKDLFFETYLPVLTHVSKKEFEPIFLMNALMKAARALFVDLFDIVHPEF